MDGFDFIQVEDFDEIVPYEVLEEFLKEDLSNG